MTYADGTFEHVARPQDGWPKLNKDCIALKVEGREREPCVIAWACEELEASSFFGQDSSVIMAQIDGEIEELDDPGLNEAIAETFEATCVPTAWQDDPFSVWKCKSGPGEGLFAVGVGSNYKKRVRAARVALMAAVEMHKGHHDVPDQLKDIVLVARIAAQTPYPRSPRPARLMQAQAKSQPMRSTTPGTDSAASSGPTMPLTPPEGQWTASAAESRPITPLTPPEGQWVYWPFSLGPPPQGTYVCRRQPSGPPPFLGPPRPLDLRRRSRSRSEH